MPSERSSLASNRSGSTRATSTSEPSCPPSGRSRARGGRANVGARRHVAFVLARRLDVEGRLQGRLRSPEARRDHGRAARQGGSVPGTVPRQGPPGRRAEGRAASRSGGGDDGGRPRSARRRGTPRGAPARSGRSCETVRSGSMRVTSSSGPSGCHLRRGDLRARSLGPRPTARRDPPAGRRRVSRLHAAPASRHER